MSAEILRRAAALIRERAEAATGGQSGSPTWKALASQSAYGVVAIGAVRIATTDERIGQPDHNAEHIASWHPAVALAVADWLDTAGADLWAHGPLCECGSGCHNCDDSLWQPHVRRALAVARAYLGESQ